MSARYMTSGVNLVVQSYCTISENEERNKFHFSSRIARVNLSKVDTIFMYLNPNKCLSMWFGTHIVWLSFSLQGTEIDIVDKMTLFGVSIDNSLTFNSHVKVSSMLQIFKRYKRLIPIHVKTSLYLANCLLHLAYGSIVWKLCGKRNADKLERRNESILRFVFNDFNSSYDKL